MIVSCLSRCRRTISARNSAPLLSFTLGDGLDFENCLATGVLCGVRFLSWGSGPAGDRLCGHLGLGSWMEEDEECLSVFFFGSWKEEDDEESLEAASSVNKYWSSGFSDDISAAGLCDRLVVCEGGVTDGTCTWRVQAARSGGALAFSACGPEWFGRARREEWCENAEAGDESGESHLMS